MDKPPHSGRRPVQGSCMRSMEGHWGATKARGEITKFSLAERDEREAAAHEAPPQRDGDATNSPREANSWREVSSPMTLHPPYLTACRRSALDQQMCVRCFDHSDYLGSHCLSSHAACGDAGGDVLRNVACSCQRRGAALPKAAAEECALSADVRPLFWTF